MEMLKTVLLLWLCFFPSLLFGFDWKSSLISRFSYNYVELDNWTAGGTDTWAWNIYMDGRFTGTSDHHIWKNLLDISYGIVWQQVDPARKSIDEFRFESIYSFSKGAFTPFVSLLFNTQLATGADYTLAPPPNLSFAFDPFYFTQTVGFEYRLDKVWMFRYGLAHKLTVVDRSTLTTDKSELGANFNLAYDQTWREGLRTVSSLQLFSAFESWDRTDVYWDAKLLMDVIQNVKLVYAFRFIYDFDVSHARQLTQSLNLAIQLTII